MKLSSSAHWVKSSQTTGQPSTRPVSRRSSSRSSSVVTGVIRSTIESGNATCSVIQAPSPASRRVAKAVTIRRATCPLPWMLSHDITVNGSVPAVRRRASASARKPNVVTGAASPRRSAWMPSSRSSKSPVTGLTW